MLKALIQLFAEKFLKGKYPDIAYQVRGKSSAQTTITITNPSEQYYTAPYSGYVLLRVSSSENTWFRLENQTSKTGYLTNAAGSWKAATLSVKKGDVVVLGLSESTDTSKASCSFIPCVCEP